MARPSGDAGHPRRGAGRKECICPGTRCGMATRQRLMRCLAISASLHLLLVLSIAPRIGAAGTPHAAPPPAVSAALTGFLVARVSSGVDGASNHWPVAPWKPPANDSVVTAPAEPTVPQSESGPSLDIPAQLVPLAEPHYFRASELDRRPRALSDIQPQFPPSAEGSTSGRIVLRLLINETGLVDAIVVEHSELPRTFQDSAIDAFSKAVFAPGEIGGNAVGSEMRIEISYENGG